MNPPVPEAIGVIGAGIMGSGIAQLAAQAGARTLLYDPIAEGLEQGTARLVSNLNRLVERGKLPAEDAQAALSRLEVAGSLADLALCGIVIEAAPERLDLKTALFGELAGIVGPDCVLATNTSSLSVTEIAAGVGGDAAKRVVGLHFFNPPPVMKLVEVVPGLQTSKHALAIARAVGSAMGRTPIDAADVAGFLVNRVNRPFGLTALRLLQERVATVEQIDRIARMEGGFRMGPFELQDLVGLETNHAVAEAFRRQSYGEPRYQPSPIQARMVAAGRLGRKTGEGWYSYAAGTRVGEYRPPDPEPPVTGGGDGRVVAIRGELPVLRELGEAARAAGFTVTDGGEAWLTIVGDASRGVTGPRAFLLHQASLHARDVEAAGFHVLAPLGSLVEVTSTPRSDPQSIVRLAEFVTALGCIPEAVADAPGLVLGRIVTALINEAAFVIGEGNGSVEDVDSGMTLGLNHPRGPVAWSRALGLSHVIGLIDALHRELGEERYRVAPLLRRLLALGATWQ